MLFFQLSYSVLAQWPLSSIKNYRSSGTGQFVIDAGRGSPHGTGEYCFITRLAQDDNIFDKLDKYVMEAAGEVRVFTSVITKQTTMNSSELNDRLSLFTCVNVQGRSYLEA